MGSRRMSGTSSVFSAVVNDPGERVPAARHHLIRERKATPGAWPPGRAVLDGWNDLGLEDIPGVGHL